jgi:hypothetical protein
VLLDASRAVTAFQRAAAEAAAAEVGGAGVSGSGDSDRLVVDDSMLLVARLIPFLRETLRCVSSIQAGMLNYILHITRFWGVMTVVMEMFPL